MLEVTFYQDCTFDLFSLLLYNENEETKVAHMIERKFYIYLDSHERAILLYRLCE